ncbi:MAG: hypothetical protein A3H95_16835 [Acidobacteria bacterium RIFCSPLOWO2_02_FULL_64_15]|nr:MAG: hypothetical protein A3H95_16835 [Acidobacteria bacterium RIFCSPLOWO2_02_FULL_64_15]
MAVTQKDSAEWAGIVAGQLLDQEAATQLGLRTAEHEATAFRERLTKDGPIFVARLAAEMEAVTRLFNTRMGTLSAVYQMSLRGALTITAPRSRAYVCIAPDLQVDDGNVPGVKVLIDDGRRSQRYFQFVAEGGQLKLWVDGQAHGPEAFARAVLEPWLRALPLHGR